MYISPRIVAWSVLTNEAKRLGREEKTLSILLQLPETCAEMPEEVYRDLDHERRGLRMEVFALEEAVDIMFTNPESYPEPVEAGTDEEQRHITKMFLETRIGYKDQEITLKKIFLENESIPASDKEELEKEVEELEYQVGVLDVVHSIMFPEERR